MSSNQENHTETEEVSRADKIKIIVGLGVAAVGGNIVGIGLEDSNVSEGIVGVGILAASTLYAVKHMPKETRELLKDVFIR